jgi:hypothetical protein
VYFIDLYRREFGHQFAEGLVQYVAEKISILHQLEHTHIERLSSCFQMKDSLTQEVTAFADQTLIRLCVGWRPVCRCCY